MEIALIKKPIIQYTFHVFMVIFFFLSPLFAAPKDVIVIFRSYGPDDDKLFLSIKKELTTQYNLFDMIITQNSKCNEFDFAIRRWNPQLVIITGNKSVELFAAYQSGSSNKPLIVPSLLIVNSLDARFQTLIPKSTALILDIPLSTSLLCLQSVFQVKLTKPGVIYRSMLTDFVEKEKQRLKKHSITLSSVCLNDRRQVLPSTIQEGITQLIDTAKIDCLILPDDPQLFTDDLLPIWQSCLSQRHLPVVSNYRSPSLDSSDFVLFTFFPDTSSVALQISRKVQQIHNNNWNMTSNVSERIISIKKSGNLTVIGQYPNISSDLFKTFDYLNE
jgi:hypothetical protein